MRLFSPPPTSTTGRTIAVLFAFAWVILVTRAAAVSSETLASAQSLFDTGKDTEALHAYTALAQEDPTNPEPQRYLGLLAFRRNDPDAAIAAFEKAIALAPTHAETRCRLGDSYGRKAQVAGLLSKFGWAKKCLAAYERAAADDPGCVRAHESLFGYYLNAPSIAGGGKEKARAEAETLKRIAPPRGVLAFAQLYQSEKDNARALAEYDAYLATMPNDFYVNYQVGKLCDTTGIAPDRGLAALGHCLELPPLAPPDAPKHQHAHWRIGNILKARGDLAGARAAYEAALKVDPTFANAAQALKAITKQ
jgi:tetratricopeptide (TPR) repeat protein